jgi:uncharacterized membrane protein YdjX (TVP38/TMEM64 family)
MFRARIGPRLLLLAVLAAVVAAFYLTGLHRELSWDNVRARVHGTRAWVGDHLLAAAVAFFGIYFVVAAVSLPVAVILTLIGGALFGVWLGTALVSVASTLGATVAMLMSRYLLGDWVQGRWGERLAAFNRGVERDGAYYLLTLRLVPLFPFWLINLGVGLTKMSARTFVWVSWLGMLPVTILYVYFGQELGRISSPRDVLSPGVWIALALLGIVPLVLRWMLKRRAAA